MNFELQRRAAATGRHARKYLANDYDFETRKAIVASADAASATAVWATFAEMGLLAIAAARGRRRLRRRRGRPDGGDGGLRRGAGGRAAAGHRRPGRRGWSRAPASAAQQHGDAARRRSTASCKLAFAHLEPGARYDLRRSATRAKRDGAGWVLDGEKCVVIGAPLADTLLVSARTAGKPGDAPGISLFLVDRERRRA